MAGEKSIHAVAHKCDSKATDVDFAFVDEDIGCQQLMESDEQKSDISNEQMDVEEVRIPLKNEHRPTIEVKQQKTITNIMIALKEGKTRENSSPMRGNRMKAGAVSNKRTITEASFEVPNLGAVTPGSKATVGTPPPAPSKTISDSVKRIPGVNPLKHQVWQLNALCFYFHLCRNQYRY